MTADRPSAPLPRDAAEMGRWHAEANPGHYRQLALYLQVLRQVLPGSVDQAVFQLATQIHPGRYAALSPERRSALHRSLADLVRRCASLLTVEQVAALAARLELRRRERQRQRNRQLVQRLIGASRAGDDSDAGLGLAPEPFEAAGAGEGGGPSASPLDDDVDLPPGSVSLAMDLPLRPERFGVFAEAGDAFAGGFDDAAEEGELLDDGDLEDDRNLKVDDLGDSGWDPELGDGEEREDEEPEDGPGDGSHPGRGDFGSGVHPGDPDGQRGSQSPLRLSDSGLHPHLSAWLWPSDDASEGSGGAEGADPPAEPPSFPGEPPPAETGSWIHGDADPGLLPRDPLQLEAWLRAYDQALSRRLRHLSHAINAELMRCGLLPVLLPSSLLDAVLEGRIDTLGAAPNLLRLQLPMALPGGEEPLQPTVVLLRCADLELEQPKLRSVRRELQRRRQEGRRMAQHHRRLQRRLQAREAEALWLQDIRNRQPGIPPPQVPS